MRINILSLFSDQYIGYPWQQTDQCSKIKYGGTLLSSYLTGSHVSCESVMLRVSLAKSFLKIPTMQRNNHCIDAPYVP